MARVPVAKRVDLQTTDDAQQTILRFHTAAGEIAVGLANKELSNLVALLLQQSEKVAIAKIAQTSPRDRERRFSLTGRPVELSGVAIAKGRTDKEATLLIEVGNMSLMFWTDKALLQGLCGELQSTMEAFDPPQRLN